MAARFSFLPPPLHDALVAIGRKLETGKSVGVELDTAIGLMAGLPPSGVARLDGAIAFTANLYRREPRTIWNYLIGRRPTDAGQLRRTPDLRYLFLFHRDGRLREAALNSFTTALPDPFVCSAILWRLNDWAKPVREAAIRCAKRTLPRTEAGVLAKTVADLLVQQQSWGRWADEREILDSLLARPDLSEELFQLIKHARTGPLASVLRYALQTSALDNYLSLLATDAKQPSVRSVALEALINRKAEWPSGSTWQWIDKSMGVRRRVTTYDSRPLAGALSRDHLIAQGIEDRSAVVRRLALDGVIRHMLGTPEALEYAKALASDRSPSVRERASFILRPANVR